MSLYISFMSVITHTHSGKIYAGSTEFRS